MDLKHTEREHGKVKNSSKSKTSNIRRPFALCVIPYHPYIEKGAAETERNFPVYKG